MTVELVLMKLDHGGSVDGKSIQRIEGAIRQILEKEGKAGGCVEISENRILVELPDGTAEVAADHALFPIDNLTPLTVKVIFEVAKVGGMVILTEGGDCPAIITNASQRSQLPEEEWRDEKVSPLCQTPEVLQSLLQGWLLNQKGFRAKAKAEKKKLDESTTLPNASVAKTLRHDMRTGQFVECTKERQHLFSWRFNPEENQLGVSPKILDELKEICARHLKEVVNLDDRQFCRIVDTDTWPPISFRHPDYSTEIWCDRSIMSFFEWSVEAAHLMFEVAQVGDFSISLPGVILLTNPSQGVRTPESWKSSKRILKCESSRSLYDFVTTYLMNIPENARVYKFDPRGFVPGTYPDLQRVLYVEAMEMETYIQHQKKLYKHRPQDPAVPFRPTSGLMMARRWELSTPDGHRYFAYGYGGEGWQNVIKDFAQSTERRIGAIVNFETFVQDRGESFLVSDCKIFETNSV